MSRPDTQRRDDLLVVALACGASVENAAQRRLQRTDGPPPIGRSRVPSAAAAIAPRYGATHRRHVDGRGRRSGPHPDCAPGGRDAAAGATGGSGTTLEAGLPSRERTDLKPRLADLQEASDESSASSEAGTAEAVAEPVDSSDGRDEQLLGALACGAGVEQAARRVKCNEKTVRRRLADPVFQRRLQQVRADMAERAAAMLTAAALESVKTLIALTADTMPPRVRWGAAQAILELAAPSSGSDSNWNKG